jgi:hypothetical protein
MLYKRYVDVLTLINKEGEMVPLIIVWDDGVKYKIDKVMEIKKAVSTVGGSGILYKCRIQGQERSLFFEKNRWFIESLHP